MTRRPDRIELRRYPGASRLLMNATAGRSARGVRTLAGSSDWRRDLTDRIGAAAVAVFGPHRVGPPVARWAWPPIEPNELIAMLRPDLPGIHLIGAAEPRQRGRERLSVLCRYGGNTIIVKLGIDRPGASLSTETEVLGLLQVDPLPGIATPIVIAAGTIVSDGTEHGTGPVRFIATTSIAVGRQRAAIDVALRTFESDLAHRLAALTRPADVDPRFVPSHGDLTPWNLRRTRRGLALFDWESAGWREPGFDLKTYRRGCDEIRPFWRRGVTT